MYSVDKILDFINNSENLKQDSVIERQPDRDSINEEITEATPILKTESQQQTLPVATPSGLASDEVNNTDAKAPDLTTMEVKEYKTVLRKLNKAIKNNNYPCIVSINGINKVYNNEIELNNELSTLKSNKRNQLKEVRKKNIENYKHYKQTYNKDIDDIEEDNVIYSKGPIKAIRKDDKLYKVPKTDSKDRKRIYNSIKDNKQVMVDLVKAKDETEFKEINNNNLKDDVLDIYKQHSENVFNKDNTWTKESFLSLMNKLIMEASPNTNKNTITSNRTQYGAKPKGLNPLLFKH